MRRTLKNKTLRRHLFGAAFVQHMLDELYPLFSEIVRFTVSGGAGTGVYLVFLVALKSGLHWEYLWAAVTAFVPLLVVNFELQRRIVFRSASPEKRRRYLVWFVPKQVGMWAAASGPVEILSAHFGFWYLPVQVLSIVLFAFVSYGLSKLIFRR